MPYDSRIPADPEYLRSVGRAFYNFTYLEWVVVWTIVKLSSDGFESVPRGKPAHLIAKAFITAIAKTTPALPDDLRRRLVKFHERYLEAIKRRNKLFTPIRTPQMAVHSNSAAEAWSGLSKLSRRSRSFLRTPHSSGMRYFMETLLQRALSVRSQTPNQAMQLTASQPDVYALSVCRRASMLRGMHIGLAAADLVSR